MSAFSFVLLNEKYAISPDPSFWKEYGTYDVEDPDDSLHEPEREGRGRSRRGHLFTTRGLANIGCLFILVVGILGLL